MSPEDMRDLVSVATIHRNIYQGWDSISLIVHSLRDRGVSWSLIGQALNISRQAAQQRYGRS